MCMHGNNLWPFLWKLYQHLYQLLHLWKYISYCQTLINLNIETKLKLDHLYMSTKKQIFRKLSKTNLSSLKSHLKVIINHNVALILIWQLQLSMYFIFDYFNSLFLQIRYKHFLRKCSTINIMHINWIIKKIKISLA